MYKWKENEKKKKYETEITDVCKNLPYVEYYSNWTIRYLRWCSDEYGSFSLPFFVFLDSSSFTFRWWFTDPIFGAITLFRHPDSFCFSYFVCDTFIFANNCWSARSKFFLLYFSSTMIHSFLMYKKKFNCVNFQSKLLCIVHERKEKE